MVGTGGGMFKKKCIISKNWKMKPEPEQRKKERKKKKFGIYRGWNESGK
jgi:hypothetical protein